MDIECGFEELGSLAPYLTSDNERKKYGRYEGGRVPCFAQDRKWSVAANIILSNPIKSYLDSGMTEGEIVEACVNFLNKKPKYARKLPYGNLACRHYIFHADRISVSLMTDDRNNKHFWGRGDVHTIRKHARRGRPRKNK